MARKLRLEYAGAIYHVMSRGDHREPIFKDDDRKVFLKTLREASGKTGWEVHAFCLMENHFHLLVETPAANLVAGMVFRGDEFKKELAEPVGHGMGPEHYRAERREGAEVLAEAIVEQEMRRRGWGDAELASRPKGDDGKLSIAERLRAETTVPVNLDSRAVGDGRTAPPKPFAPSPQDFRKRTCQNKELSPP